VLIVMVVVLAKNGPGASGLRYLKDSKRIRHRDPSIEFLLISFN
jgi:hypothetical protein